MSPESDAIESAGKAQLMASGLVGAGLPPQRMPVTLRGFNPPHHWKRRLSDWWYGVKVKLGLATDWLNADNAPPAFSSTPHKYIQMPDLNCCPICGGGRLHKIHNRSKG